MKLDLEAIEALKAEAEAEVHHAAFDALSGRARTLRAKRILALIDELAETRRGRDEERAALITALASAPQSLANARAAAFEEAAKILRDSADVFEVDAHLDDPPHGRGFDKALVYRSAAASILDGIHSPPSVACVPVETLRSALSDERDGDAEACDAEGSDSLHFGLYKSATCPACARGWAAIHAHNKARETARAVLAKVTR